MAAAATLQPADRSVWRAWLEANHATSPGVWVVHPKRRYTEAGGLDYEAVVEEALCFGWIDSRAKAVDERRTSLYVAPRRPGSIWAASNKARLERLVAAGLVTRAGLAIIERAKADGSWTSLDRAEAAVEPPDLLAALDARPGARAIWDAFPRSERRMVIGWIEQAKRPATRAARVEMAADRTAEGTRVGQWGPRHPRPGVDV